MPRPTIQVGTPLPGPAYTCHRDLLWGIRNSLIHNALNVAAYLSAAENHEMSFKHLEVTDSPDGLRIFINTAALCRDFERALSAVRKKLSRESALRDRASSRLGRAEVGHDQDQYTVTLPPPVCFVIQE